MREETFSNHIGNASELTMIAEIKPGLVPVRETISYASRLRRHLRMLSALRRVGLESDRGGLYVGPIDMLRTLQYVKWTLIEDDTKMLLSVNFDRPLEPYIRRIVDIAGPLLDTILCHCVGFHGHYSDLGFQKFAEFPALNQVPVELFAAASPNFSVDDADYFTELDAELRRGKVRRDFENAPDGQVGFEYTPVAPEKFNSHTAKKTLLTPRQRLRQSRRDDRAAVLHQALNIIRTMYDGHELFPETDDEDNDTRDDLLYYRLTERLVPNFWSGLRRRIARLAKAKYSQQEIKQLDHLKREDFWKKMKSILKDLDPQELEPRQAYRLKFFRNLLLDFEEPLDWFARQPEPRSSTQSKWEPDTSPAQVPIGQKPNKSTHACLVFLSISPKANPAQFLRSMREHLFLSQNQPVEANDKPQVYWTLSLTYSALETLEIEEEIRLKFPAAFREGMAERAGLLGDTDHNHPREWEWPKDREGNSIDPAGIDLIIQLQTHDPEVNPETDFADNDPSNAGHVLNGALNLLTTKAEENGIAILGFEAMHLRRSDSGHATGHLGIADGVSQPNFLGPKEPDDYNVELKHPLRPHHDHLDKSKKHEVASVSHLGDLRLGEKSSLDYISKSISEEGVLACSKEKDGTKHPVGFDDYELPLLGGTFQVIRKIGIDINAFKSVKDHVDNNSRGEITVESIQEKLFGRKLDGTALIPGHRDVVNDFNFEHDPKGLFCPLQSHIRRANPRKQDTPRILRRGFSYGAFNDEEQDRGLFFIAYNANLAEQFEVIQRWITGGNSTGIPSQHADPILAPVRPNSNRVFRYLDSQGETIRVELPDIPMTQLKWGLYAFVPSSDGLDRLADLAEAHNSPFAKEAAAGAVIKEKRIDSLKDPQQKGNAWKILLEDRDHNRRSDREAIWAWIREKNKGVFDTGDEDEFYGVLVGSAEGVRQVFESSGTKEGSAQNTDDSLSVRDYWYRMRESIGPLKLGFDPRPLPIGQNDKYFAEVNPGDHAEDVRVLSTFVAEMDLDRIFTDARDTTLEYLSRLPEEYQPSRRPAIGRPPSNLERPAPKLRGKRIDLVRMIDDVAAQLSVNWFGLPEKSLGVVQIGGHDEERLEDKKIPHCPQDLLNASFYVFGPTPTPTVRQKATSGFTPKFAGILGNYAMSISNPPKNTLLERLLEAHEKFPAYWDKTKIGEALAGVTFGFVGPVPGSFLTMMYDWIDEGFLWRAQQIFRAKSRPQDRATTESVLSPFVISGMQGSPIPDLLYRRAVKDITIGGKKIKAGRRITISIASAMVDDPKSSDLLFGGNYFDPHHKAAHACPGQKMGLNTIYGVLAALFQHGRLRAEGPFTLRLDKNPQISS